jgi:hypothetical protein
MTVHRPMTIYRTVTVHRIHPLRGIRSVYTVRRWTLHPSEVTP